MEVMQPAITASLPLVIDLEGLMPDEFITYYAANRQEMENRLYTAGALKFRGVMIDSMETFNHIVQSISEKFLNYIDGTSPRTKLSGSVYTSTEYSQSMKITMHNENSYSSCWPCKLFLSCLQPAETGGETFLADSREMLRRMNPDIVAEIRAKGIVYIRNLHSGNGVGLSWQQAFETTDKAVMEEHCRQRSIAVKWREGDMVRLEQESKGIIRHRQNHQEVWFNQIDQFHPVQLGQELYDAMMTIYDSPEEFPTYVRFGDGSVISEAMVTEILKTADDLTVAPSWSRNELLIVDNELTSHGRNAYTGERKVLLAMSN